MSKYLFIRGDGTIIKSGIHGTGRSLNWPYFVPGAISQLSRICDETTFKIVLLNKSIQSQVSTRKPRQDLIEERALDLLAGEGVTFSIISDTDQKYWNTRFGKEKVNPAQCYVVSHLKKDIEFAHKLGAKGIFFGKKADQRAVLCTTHWNRIYHMLRFEQRYGELVRKTDETTIRISLNLDGAGLSNINCPLGFLSHMLELFAKHSGFDLTADISGDIGVDEHHTVEDTAIVLGKVFYRALGEKTGISRYGFLLPMDEARAEVAVDLSGRSFLVWKTQFRREKIGDMPTELFYHFFKSFTDNAQCNLYVRAKGKNEHHKIEAIFKAFARTLKMAVQRDPVSSQIPSTKGLL